jgi:glutamine---fructose-6-phosphate transaminase (isomerizing)
VVAPVKTRCTRCLLPATYPGVTFDADGVCNYCLDYSPSGLLGEERFLQKVRSRKGVEYDCVVGISGGKDSCYVAYLAEKKYGLRALAVCYDFTFMVDLARQNVRAVCDSLGLDLLVVKSRNNLEYDFMRRHLMSLAGTGTTWGQCMFCHYGIEAVLYQTARRKGIPWVLSGVTPSETWWDPGNRTGILAKRLKNASLSDKLAFGLHQGRAYLKLVDQRRQFPIPGNTSFNVYKRARPAADGPETIKVFEYLEWDQDTIEKTLQAEAGWKKPDKSLSWRYDCVLEPLLDYTYVQEFGISSAGLYLSNLVRAGDMDREEALALLEELEDQTRLDQSLKDVLTTLHVPCRTQAKFFRARRSEQT